jgi:hypothetical protein
MEGNIKATAEYIFPNQMEDAAQIVHLFYAKKRRVIVVQKKTKVGADGLMIEVAKLLSTHPDDDFVRNFTNVRFITGMSNAKWEKDMIEKAPTCFKDKIFHHGQLKKSDLGNIKNGLILIDEIDTGDKECSQLHKTLREAGILDVKHMEENNNIFLLISATMIKELYDMYRWGDYQELYQMTIPGTYIGHIDFLRLGILQEFYPLNTEENCKKWVEEDIIDNYADDYRVHIVRLGKSDKDGIFLQQVCAANNIIYRNHTSTDRISDEEWNEIFSPDSKQHIVLVVKGLLKRATRIADEHKKRIGAIMEYTGEKGVDYNVQIQGLVGRMTGYDDWLLGGHRTGPFRTSIPAIEAYEEIYKDPFGKNSYHCAGFRKDDGKVFANPTMLSAKNIANLVAVDLPNVNNDPNLISQHPEPFKTIEEVNHFLTQTLKKPTKIKAFHEIDGYLLSTRLNSYYKKAKKYLEAEDRILLDTFHKINLGMNISSTGKGQNYMVYPVYDNLETKEVSFYVRYLNEKK